MIQKRTMENDKSVIHEIHCKTKAASCVLMESFDKMYRATYCL